MKDFAKREDVIVATKFLPRTKKEIEEGISTRAHIENSLNQSLKNLGMDYVDLYIYHMWDYNARLEEIMETLNDLVKSGKIKYIGTSNCFAYQLAKAGMQYLEELYVPHKLVGVRHKTISKRRNRMKIVVLIGSPNRNGSTNMIAREFEKGALKAGHQVVMIDVAHANVGVCGGCVACGYEGPCVKKDDMEIIKKEILSADMLVFATPLYYYGMTSQLKTIIDRFCAINASLQRKHMKSALLAVAWNSDSWTFDALVSHYKTLVRYLNFQDCGMILGIGCGTPGMTARSIYIKNAYDLGKSLK